MNDKYETIINTVERHQRVFVDKFDDNEVWLSIQVVGGGANCRLNIEQAVDLVEALNRIIESHEKIDEAQAAAELHADQQVKEMLERGL